MKQGLMAFGPLLAALVLSGPAHASPLTSDITVTTGALHAPPRDAQGVLAFQGIPYAAPPVGDLRWRSPQPAKAWQGVRDATATTARCMAPPGNITPEILPESEDCLFLNVWTAARSTDEKRPVMVWLHGGGFVHGSNTEAYNNGAHLAAKGVVDVSLNYRIGVLGFLATSALDHEGSPSGDFGLQDQIAALKWVRANIAKFGGDPNNVTIFGESAGAMSVGLLMTSPLARGLFERAIGESGAYWESQLGSMRTHAQALARGNAFVDRVAHGSIADLRAMPARAVIEQAGSGREDPVTREFSPNIDGHVIPAAPASVFAQGHQTHVPLLAGWNEREGYLFLRRALPHANPAEFKQAAAAQFGEDRLADFLKVYPASTEEQANTSAEALLGDLVIREQIWEWLQSDRRTGNSPVYGYEFNYKSAYSPMPVHSAEIDFVFGTLQPQHFIRGAPEAAPDARDHQVSEQMVSYWTNFARNGDPNGPGLPNWPKYQDRDSQVMVFGPDKTAAGPQTGTARYRFIESFRGKDGRFPNSWQGKPE